MKYLFSTLFTAFTIFTNFAQSNDFIKQQKEVLKVIEIINDVRANPKKNWKMFRTFDIRDYKISKTQLKYNKQLSKDCYEYAKELSHSNIFEHSTGNNYCESISFGGNWLTEVYEFINEISADEGEDGHRRHMLGCYPFDQDTEIGVGFYTRNHVLYTVIRTK